MKIIKSSVNLLEQQPGVIGMLKHIERVGRISYKSEDKITEDSYKKFIQMLYNRGHWAVFNLGAVYLQVPVTGKTKDFLDSLKAFHPFTRWNTVGGVCYITTNYRIIKQLKLEDDVIEKYWSEPGKNHKLYVTSHWICSRGTSHQIVRHRLYSFIQESQRFVNYSKDKFGGEITYILPQWVYRVRDIIGHTIDPLTYQPRDYILDLDGEELWNDLTCIDRTVAARDNLWKACEEEYLYECRTDEGEQLRPEEARGVLCNDTKTELCMGGFLEDWFYTPAEDTKEKAGFFYLRTAKDAQPDIRVLAESLKQQMIEHGLS